MPQAPSGRHVARFTPVVADELHPGPAFALIVEGDRLAEQRLAVEGCVEARLAPQRHGGGDDLAGLAFHVA